MPSHPSHQNQEHDFLRAALTPYLPDQATDTTHTPTVALDSSHSDHTTETEDTEPTTPTPALTTKPTAHQTTEPQTHHAKLLQQLPDVITNARWNLTQPALWGCVILTGIIAALLITNQPTNDPEIVTRSQPTPSPQPATTDPPTPISPTPISPTPISQTTTTTTPPTAPQPIPIHIVGQVHKPGVWYLPEGSLVIDAVTKAGGLTRKADTTSINLARQLTPGEHIHVPAPGETIPTLHPTHTPKSPQKTTPNNTTLKPNTPINLNTANTTQLQQLPGIGPVTAQRIIDWRTNNGPFTTVSELQQVRGIGPAAMTRLTPHLTT